VPNETGSQGGSQFLLRKFREQRARCARLSHLLGADVRSALITSWIVLLVILVLAWIWTRLRGRRRDPSTDSYDREHLLTSAAKHFAVDMESRARQTGPRWQAEDQERALRLPAAFGKDTQP
jgi:hypothetical protein